VLKALESAYGIPRRRGSPEALSVLVGTILSQNTNDRNRDLAHERLEKRFPTWGHVARATQKQIAEAIRPGGLANQKAKHIKAVLAWVHGRFGAYDLAPLSAMTSAEVFEMLTGLDGVGVKTAAVLLCFALKRDVFPVDTHVHRVSRRLGFVSEKTSRDGTFEAMKPLVPRGKAYSFHLNVIRFGREICHARNPECGACFLFEQCVWPGRFEAAKRPSKE